MEAEPPAQGAGVSGELNGGPATCCPQRTEGLPRGGKDVHRFGAQKRSESSQTTHRSFVWTVPLGGPSRVTARGSCSGYLVWVGEDDHRHRPRVNPLHPRRQAHLRDSLNPVNPTFELQVLVDVIAGNSGRRVMQPA